MTSPRRWRPSTGAEGLQADDERILGWGGQRTRATKPKTVEVQTAVTFVEDAGKTTLSVHQVFSHESDATRGAKAGWTQTLDQLAEHVKGRM